MINEAESLKWNSKYDQLVADQTPLRPQQSTYEANMNSNNIMDDDVAIEEPYTTIEHQE